MKLFISVCLLIFVFGTTVFPQSQNEKGLNYALTELSKLNRKPQWKNKGFVDKYKRNLTKANNYLSKIRKDGAERTKIAMFENRIKAFKMMFEMNTQQKVPSPAPRPTPASAPPANETDMQRKIRERNEKLRREWEESQAAVWRSHKDDGVGSAVHKSNVGKIRFGAYRYGQTSDFKEQFAVEAPFSYHLFLPKSVQNLAVEQAKETKDRRWLAVTSNKIMFVVSVDGKLMHKWVEISPDSVEPNTYYSDEVMLKQPVDVYGRGDFYGFYVREVLLKFRKGGALNVKVEAYLYNLTIREERSPKVAEGNFKVNFNAAQWAKLDRERNIKRERHAYNIPCRHALSFRTSPNGVKSEYSGRGSTMIYKKGQKIYVYNPVSKSTRFLMTLTSSSQAINVPANFCSY